MKKRTTVKIDYRHRWLDFKLGPKLVSVPKEVSAILKNPETDEEDLTTNSFKLDTGADITVLNRKYEEFLKKMEPFDEVKLIFGSSSKASYFPVYKIKLIISGNEFELIAAYVAECPYLLLGHYKFFESLDYTLFDSISKTTKLFKIK